MPQMAPLFWTLISLLFILTFLLTISKIYFNFLQNPSSYNKNLPPSMNLPKFKW